MRTARRRVAVRTWSIVLALLTTACGSSGLASPSPGANADLDGSWQLTAGSAPGGAIPILADRPITLVIAGTEISGSAACNTYGGRLVAADGGLRIEDLGVTAMGCDAPTMAAESAYVSALGFVRRIARDAEELVASGDGVELRFMTMPEPVDAELVDTTWVLGTVIMGDVAASTVGQRATLQLGSDGGLSGSTGCRTFEGSWVERDDQVVAIDLTATDVACDPGVGQQDDQVMSVIGDGFLTAIDGRLLVVTDPGGIALVYRTDQ